VLKFGFANLINPLLVVSICGLFNIVTQYYSLLFYSLKKFYSIDTKTWTI